MIRYISDPRSEAEIRTRFEERLPAWDKHGEQWLCLVMREKHSGEAVGITGFRPQWVPYRQAEVGYGSLPAGQGKGYGKESLRAVLDFAVNACGFHKLTATVTAGNPLRAACWNRAAFSWKARCAITSVWRGSGATTGCSGCWRRSFRAANKNIAPGIDKLVGAALCSIFGQFAGLRRSDGPGANVYRGIPMADNSPQRRFTRIERLPLTYSTSPPN